jgi:hypothetical protein
VSLTALLEIVDPCAQPGLDQPRREAEPPGQFERKIGGVAAIGPGNGLRAVRRGVCVQQAAAQELPRVVPGGGGADRPRHGPLVPQGIVVEPVQRDADGAPALDGRRRGIGPSSRPRPTQPSPVWSRSSSRAKCQINILRNCDRLGLGYPTPGHNRQQPRLEQLPRVTHRRHRRHSGGNPK